MLRAHIADEWEPQSQTALDQQGIWLMTTVLHGHDNRHHTPLALQGLHVVVRIIGPAGHTSPDVAIVLAVEHKPKHGLARLHVVAGGRSQGEAGLPPGLEGERHHCCICPYPPLEQHVLVDLHRSQVLSAVRPKKTHKTKTLLHDRRLHNLLAHLCQYSHLHADAPTLVFSGTLTSSCMQRGPQLTGRPHQHRVGNKATQSPDAKLIWHISDAGLQS